MKAAIYCRLSREDADRMGESESIQNQKSMLLRYAAENGMDVCQIYCDEDYSGMDRERPAFNALLRAASERRFDVVLAKTQSRFTRDMELVERYLHGSFAEWGVRFVAVVDHVDTDDRGNKKSRQLNGLINEWYLEDLSNNVRSVLDHKRRGGQYIASFALYGYRKDPGAKGRLQIDPEAAAVVRRIFSMALQGAGVRRIAQTLSAEGVPNPTAYKQLHGEHYRLAEKNGASGLWSAATVYQMLHNQTYAGDLVQGRHKKVSYKSKKTVWLPPEQWIVVPETHAPIVSRETFETVQSMMERRARSGAGGAVHPLARKLVCGGCGSLLEQCGSAAKKGGVRRRYVRCRMHQRLPARCPNKTCTDLNALQETVRRRMQAHLAAYFEPERMALPAPDGPARAKEQTAREELRRLKSELGRRQRALQELYLDKAAGTIGEAQFRELNRAFLRETEQLEQQAARWQAELGRAAAGQNDGRARREQVRALAEKPDLSRELAALLIGRVVVSPKDPETGGQTVRIEWLF